ncbi:hypothetical protein [Amycolatopsis sp. NPDC051102]
MNDNPISTNVANPNRIRIRTEADLRRNAQPAAPEPETVAEER